MTRIDDSRGMFRWNSQYLIELLAIAAMSAIVITLGVVQYRWADQISRTEQQRLQSALETGARNFSQEFSYDFQQLCESFQFEMAGPSNTLESRLLDRYGSWSRNSSTPNLVSAVHFWRAESSRAAYLASYEESTHSFVERPWPERFENLHQFLKGQFSDLPPRIPDREAYFYPWTLFEDTPALVRPVYQLAADSQVEPAGYLIVELSGGYLSGIFLPDLVRRTFGDPPAYDIVVRSAAFASRPIYTSGSFLALGAPDAKINLIEEIDQELRRRGGPGLQSSSQGSEWMLFAQHPAGSVQTAIAALRRRNLAISFGLLAVLAAGMILIFHVARRAKRIAAQQMEFVAGVSHELCTPLAVINSAAENLMDGVVEQASEIREYGGIIRDQGRRLEHLVDEVLQFAAGRSERAGYELRPLQIREVVSHSLEAADPMLREAGFTVEQNCPAGLPAILADSSAVSMCLENLISNAVKYTGENRWIGIRAEWVRGKMEVQLSVEDRGAGISASDLPHVFEPFYRVQSVRESPIRGVGLGLYLVQRAMEGMGGRVSVTSQVGRGSCFTLHFPVAPAAAASEPASQVLQSTD